jgi:hypothetical protein
MRRRSSPSSPIVDVIGDTTEYDRMPLPNRAAAGPEAPQKAKAEKQEDDEQEPVSGPSPRHFPVKIAVRVGYGPIALRAEPIEETKETGIILA